MPGIRAKIRLCAHAPAELPAVIRGKDWLAAVLRSQSSESRRPQASCCEAAFRQVGAEFDLHRAATLPGASLGTRKDQANAFFRRAFFFINARSQQGDPPCFGYENRMEPRSWVQCSGDSGDIVGTGRVAPYRDGTVEFLHADDHVTAYSSAVV